MKKFALMIFICSLFLISCASTKSEAPVGEPRRPVLKSKFSTETDFDYNLIKTDVKGVYVVRPNISMASQIEKNYQYTVEIVDNKTGDVVWTVDKVVSEWRGMSGWNGQVVADDYTFVTADYLQFIVKANKYYVRDVCEKGYALGNMSNPLNKTDYTDIYYIKPHPIQKSAIESDKTFTIKAYQKNTTKLVHTFDNIVSAWQGMTGWNGQVVAEDYTMIATDCRQYVVKGNRYDCYYFIDSDGNNIEINDPEVLCKNNIVFFPFEYYQQDKFKDGWSCIDFTNTEKKTKGSEEIIVKQTFVLNDISYDIAVQNDKVVLLKDDDAIAIGDYPDFAYYQNNNNRITFNFGWGGIKEIDNYQVAFAALNSNSYGFRVWIKEK